MTDQKRPPENPSLSLPADLDEALSELTATEPVLREQLQRRARAADRLKRIADERSAEIANHVDKILGVIREEYNREYAHVEELEPIFEQESETVIATLVEVAFHASQADTESLASRESVSLLLRLDADRVDGGYAMWCLKNVAKSAADLTEPYVDRFLSAANDAGTTRAVGALLCLDVLVQNGRCVDELVSHRSRFASVVTSALADDPTRTSGERRYASSVLVGLAERRPTAVSDVVVDVAAAIAECEEEVQQSIVSAVDAILSEDPSELEAHVDKLLQALDSLEPSPRGGLLLALSKFAETNPDAILSLLDEVETFLSERTPVRKGTLTLLHELGKASMEHVVPSLEDIIDCLEHRDEDVRSMAAVLLQDIATNRPEAILPFVEQLDQALERLDGTAELAMENVIDRTTMFHDSDWLRQPDYRPNQREQANLPPTVRKRPEGSLPTMGENLEARRNRLQAAMGDNEGRDWEEVKNRLRDADDTDSSLESDVLQAFLDDPSGIEDAFEDILTYTIEGKVEDSPLFEAVLLGVPHWISRAEALVGNYRTLFDNASEFGQMRLLILLLWLDEERHDVALQIALRNQEQLMQACRTGKPNLQWASLATVGKVICAHGDPPEYLEPYLDLFFEVCDSEFAWLRGTVAENLKDVSRHHPELLTDYVNELGVFLDDRDKSTRLVALQTIRRVAGEGPCLPEVVLDGIVRSFSDQSGKIRGHAVLTFAICAEERPELVTEYFDAVVSRIADRRPIVKKIALELLGEYVKEESIDALLPHTPTIAANLDGVADSFSEVMEDESYPVDLEADIVGPTVVFLLAIAHHSPAHFADQTDWRRIQRLHDDPPPDLESGVTLLLGTHAVYGNAKVEIDSKTRDIVESWSEESPGNSADDQAGGEQGKGRSLPIDHGQYELGPSHPLVREEDGRLSVDLSALTDRLDDPSPEVRREATAVLVTVCDRRPEDATELVAHVSSRLRDIDPNVRRFALFAARSLCEATSELPGELAEPAADQLGHPSPSARAAACVVLRHAGDDRLDLLRSRMHEVAALVRRSDDTNLNRNGIAIIGLLARAGIPVNEQLANAVAVGLTTTGTHRVAAVAFRDCVRGVVGTDRARELLLDAAVEVLHEPERHDERAVSKVLEGLRVLAEESKGLARDRVSAVAGILGTPYGVDKSVEMLALDVLARAAKSGPEIVAAESGPIVRLVSTYSPHDRRHQMALRILHRAVKVSADLPETIVPSLLSSVRESADADRAADTLRTLVWGSADGYEANDRHRIELVVPFIRDLVDTMEQVDGSALRPLFAVVVTLKHHDPSLVAPHFPRLVTCLETEDLRLRCRVLVAVHNFAGTAPETAASYLEEVCEAISWSNRSSVISAGIRFLHDVSSESPESAADVTAEIVELLRTSKDEYAAAFGLILENIARSTPENVGKRELDALIEALAAVDDEAHARRLASAMETVSQADPTAAREQIDQLVDFLIVDVEGRRSIELDVSTVLVNLVEEEPTAIEPQMERLIAFLGHTAIVTREVSARLVQLVVELDSTLVTDYLDDCVDHAAADEMLVRGAVARVLHHVATDDPVAVLEHESVLVQMLDDSGDFVRQEAVCAYEAIADTHPNVVAGQLDALLPRLDDDARGTAYRATAAVRKAIVADELAPTAALLDVLCRDDDDSELQRRRTAVLALAAHASPTAVADRVDVLRRRARAGNGETAVTALDGLAALPERASSTPTTRPEANQG